jgi:hypothetical protein
MRALLPSVWLLGAALYTGSILSLLQPLSGEEDWPVPPVLRETVVTKSPPAVTIQAVAQSQAPLLLAALPAKPRDERRNEWVQVGAYTSVVRSRPSTEAAPLQAYPAGRALRVLTREGSFVRVQDLGSGQLGWVEAAAVVPFTGGYRLRQTPPAEPQIAAAVPPIAMSEPQVAAVATPAVLASVKPRLGAANVKKIQWPRDGMSAVRAGKEAVAAIEPSERGLFRKKRGIQRVALSDRDTGMAAMIDRAIRGF